MAESRQKEEALRITENDIVFLCWNCSKGIVIEHKAVGMMISCPKCSAELLVPERSDPDAFEAEEAKDGRTAEQRVSALSGALMASHEDIRRISSHLTDVGKRRKHLEQLRAANIRQFERIAEELTVIQEAVDRLANILQESAAEDSGTS